MPFHTASFAAPLFAGDLRLFPSLWTFLSLSLRAHVRSLECAHHCHFERTREVLMGTAVESMSLHLPLSLRTYVRSLIDSRTWITERFQDVSLRSTWHKGTFDITKGCHFERMWEVLNVPIIVTSNACEKSYLFKDLDNCSASRCLATLDMTKKCHFERMWEVLLIQGLE